MKLRILMMFGVAFVAGCGDSIDYEQVSGTVTLNGKPLPNAWVEFQPVAASKEAKSGFGARGKTDAQGHYSLKSHDLDNDWEGAAVGKHIVRISCFDGAEGGEALSVEADQDDADNPAKRKKSNVPVIPSKYNENSELTFTVEPGGTDKANFDLVMSKRGR